MATLVLDFAKTGYHNDTVDDALELDLSNDWYYYASTDGVIHQGSRKFLLYASITSSAPPPGSYEGKIVEVKFNGGNRKLFRPTTAQYAAVHIPTEAEPWIGLETIDQLRVYIPMDQVQLAFAYDYTHVVEP